MVQDKDSSASSTHDNLKGRRQQEHKTQIPEGEDSFPADGEDYDEEEQVIATIQQLKALLLGNYTNGTARKRRESNRNHSDSDMYFKTYTDLNKLRKTGKKNRSAGRSKVV